MINAARRAGVRQVVKHSAIDASPAAREVAQVTDLATRLTGRPPRNLADFAHDLLAAA